MSLHAWHHQGPRKSSSCTAFMLSYHWAELPQAKEVLCLFTQGHFDSVRLFANLWTVDSQASLSGRGRGEVVLQGRIL